MSRRFFMIAFLPVVISFPLRTQPADPFSFFPHHTGDIWEYVSVQAPSIHWQYKITSDSSAAGRAYIDFLMHGDTVLHVLDSTSQRVYRADRTDTSIQYLQYQLNAQQGDHWVVRRDSVSTMTATVVGVYNSFVLDTVVEVKEIDYSDSASGLLFLTEYLASGFGLIGQDIDGFPDSRIRGARINGVQYGTITSALETDVGMHEAPFSLLQNYPNPFNPSTMIMYDLPRTSHVSLNVYDVLGRDVATLVNEVKEPGTYTVRWDASGLAGGVYFYRLTGRGFLESGRMVLLK